MNRENQSLKNNKVIIICIVAFLTACSTNRVNIADFKGRTNCTSNKRKEVSVLFNYPDSLSREVVSKYQKEFVRSLNMEYYPCIPTNFTIQVEKLAFNEDLTSNLYSFSENYDGRVIPRGLKRYSKLLLEVDNNLFFIHQAKLEVKVLTKNYIELAFPNQYNKIGEELILKGLIEQ